MDAIETIKNRRSIRKYKAKEIPQDVLLQVLEAARLAPSGANRQPFHLIVVTDPEKRKELVPICKNQRFVGEASVFIAGVDDPQQKWNRVDLSIALDHITLAAAENGLGTCWVGAFEPEKMADISERAQGQGHHRMSGDWISGRDSGGKVQEVDERAGLLELIRKEHGLRIET